MAAASGLFFVTRVFFFSSEITFNSVIGRQGFYAELEGRRNAFVVIAR